MHVVHCKAYVDFLHCSCDPGKPLKIQPFLKLPKPVPLNGREIVWLKTSKISKAAQQHHAWISCQHLQLPKKRLCGWRKRRWIWRLVEPIMGTPRGQLDPPRPVESAFWKPSSRYDQVVCCPKCDLKSFGSTASWLIRFTCFLNKTSSCGFLIWPYGSTFSCAKILHPLWSQFLYAIKFIHCRTGCLHVFVG